MALDILNNILPFEGGSVGSFIGGGQGNWFYLDYNQIIINADEHPDNGVEVKAFYLTRIYPAVEVEFYSFGTWVPFSTITKKVIIVSDYTKETLATYFYCTTLRVRMPYIYHGVLPFFYVRASTSKTSISSNYWSIKEILAYCDISYSNTAPLLTFCNTLETSTPNNFHIPYSLILDNSDGFDLESTPLIKVKNILDGTILKGGFPVSAPFLFEPNEFITWQFNTLEDIIIPAFTIVLNDLNDDSSSDIQINIHCNKSNNLNIDINAYLLLFGKSFELNNVKCFKCGFPLSINQNNLKCENSHIYDFKDYIYEHSSYLSSLLQNLKDGKVCDK